MKGVLTAGQIPTACEQAYYPTLTGPRSIDGVCRGTPVTHTLEGRTYRSEDEKIPVLLYVCGGCAARGIRRRSALVTRLTDYELEVAS